MFLRWSVENGVWNAFLFGRQLNDSSKDFSICTPEHCQNPCFSIFISLKIHSEIRYSQSTAIAIGLYFSSQKFENR